MTRRIELARRWYAVFCVLNGFSYLAVLALCVWFVVNRERVANEIFTAEIVMQVSVLMGLMMLMFAGVCFWLPAAKKNGGMYVVHVINLAFGTGSIVFTPLAAWLLYLFVQRDVQAYYLGKVNTKA